MHSFAWLVLIFRDKIVFFRWTLCLMDKNGILCPSKNVTLASEHVSYLENDLVLMVQIFTTFSFCKHVQFRYHYGFSIVAKENYKEKCVSIYYYSTGTLYHEICHILTSLPTWDPTQFRLHASHTVVWAHVIALITK